MVKREQSDANRKKIAVTKSDGTTQCYVEIEKWDHASKQAWLWVKVPSIRISVDTDLYLYYDKDHADNTDYVGYLLLKISTQEVEDIVRRIHSLLEKGEVETWLIDVRILREILVASLMHVILIEVLNTFEYLSDQPNH